MYITENAVKDDKRIGRAAGVCKKLVCHFSHSWKKRDALNKAQQELQLINHALITECPTRWGSRQKMMQRVLEQQKAITQVLSTDRKARHLIPTWQDIEVIESVNKALHPLQNFTDTLSGEAYVSVSFVKPVLHLLKTSILSEDDDDTDLTKSIKTKAMDYLESKYNDLQTQDILDVATFLDPRFKADYMEAATLNDIKEKLVNEVMSMMQKQSGPSASVSQSDTSATTSSTVHLAGGEKKRKISLGSFFKNLSSSATTPLPAKELFEQLFTVTKT